MLGVLVRGGFRPHDAAVTADTLQALSIGLVPFSVYLYTLRGFYALHDTFTPFWINAIENGVNIALAVALFPSLGVQGLALAWTGAYTVAAVIAVVVLRAGVSPPGRPDGRLLGRPRRRWAPHCSRSLPRRSQPRSVTPRPTARSSPPRSPVSRAASRTCVVARRSMRTPELGTLAAVLRPARRSARRS